MGTEKKVLYVFDQSEFLSAALHLITLFSVIVLKYRRMQHAADFGTGMMHELDIGLGSAAFDLLFGLLLVLFWIWSTVKDTGYFLRCRTDTPENVNSPQKLIRMDKVRGGFCLVVFVLIIMALGFSFGDEGFQEYYGQQAMDYPAEEFVPFSLLDGTVFDSIRGEIPKATEESLFPSDSNALMCVQVATQRALFQKYYTQSIDILTDEYLPEIEMYDTPRCYSQSFYEARTQKIARNYLNEEILIRPGVKDGVVEYDRLEDSYLEEIAFSLEGVDYAGYEAEEPFFDKTGRSQVQTLYLRKGKKLMIVGYIGEENLKSKAEIFARKM